MPKNLCKVLIIGGYGAFGGRLARLLGNDDRLEIIIAGRTFERAAAFADRLRKAHAGGATFSPARCDRDDNIAADIASIAPDIVVDASGPFQEYGEDRYRVAHAALACGANYVDLADARAFVLDIVELDDAATDRGVFVLSGGSTSPALTTTVAHALAKGFATIESITGGILPSPHAPLGKTVIQGVAGYAGKAVPVLSGGREATLHAFTDTRRYTIAPPGCDPLRPTTFSLLDVADVRTMTQLPVPVQSAWFGVATSPAILHWMLRVLSRAVRAGFISSLRPLAGIMHTVMRYVGRGRHRGGLFMEAKGRLGNGEKKIRSWHLIAEGDDGPIIPTFAAAAIIRRHLDGRSPLPGARPASHELDLEDFDYFFRRHAIFTGWREQASQTEKALFASVLGDAFDALPAPIRHLHGAAEKTCRGRAIVTGAGSLAARLIAGIGGFPATSGTVPLTVRIDADDAGERWTRDFGGHRFTSRLRAGQGRYAGLLTERFGAVTIGMALVVDGDRLRYLPRRWSAFGLPLPAVLIPRGEIYEHDADDRFNFHVEIRVPLIGRIVTYQGWLDA